MDTSRKFISYVSPEMAISDFTIEGGFGISGVEAGGGDNNDNGPKDFEYEEW